MSVFLSFNSSFSSSPKLLDRVFWLCVSLCEFVPVFICSCACVYVCLFVSVSFCLCACVYVYLFVSVSFCLCVSARPTSSRPAAPPPARGDGHLMWEGMRHVSETL